MVCLEASDPGLLGPSDSDRNHVNFVPFLGVKMIGSSLREALSSVDTLTSKTEGRNMGR